MAAQTGANSLSVIVPIYSSDALLPEFIERLGFQTLSVEHRYRLWLPPEEGA